MTNASDTAVRPLPHHHEERVLVSAPPAAIFAYLDDHRRLSEHMTRRSAMMAGSRMRILMDGDEGRAVGSTIRLRGRVLGIELALEEVVVERDPPVRKVWATTAPPRLLVIGPYRMGFEITSSGDGSSVSVFIDYALPDSGLEQWLARRFGAWYARWCTRRMANDAAVHFEKSVSGASRAPDAYETGGLA